MSHPRRQFWLAIALAWLMTEAAAGLCLWGLARVRNLTYDPVPEALSDVQRKHLRAFVREGNGPNYAQHPVLGWTPTAESNAGGMRDDREYDPAPAAGAVRISAFGDSFIYGSDVSLQDSWLKQLALLEPTVEVLNYGVPAYGTDQAYLRYRLVGREYQPHIVLIGYMSENLARNVNVFRPFYTSWYRDHIFTKPRFKKEGDQLRLIRNPVATREDHARLLDRESDVLRELGEHDYHYRINYKAGSLDVLPTVRLSKLFVYHMRKHLFDPIFGLDGMYADGSEAFRVTVGILDAFYREVLANGALPIIVVIPDTTDQSRARAKLERRYAPMLEALRSRGHRFVDVLAAFESVESRYSIEELTVEWGHFSRVGGGIAAEYLMNQLRQGRYLEPEVVRMMAAMERGRLGITARR